MKKSRKINLKVQVLLFYSSKCSNKHILHINEMVKQKAYKSTCSSIFPCVLSPKHLIAHLHYLQGNQREKFGRCKLPPAGQIQTLHQLCDFSMIKYGFLYRALLVKVFIIGVTFLDDKLARS